MNIEVLMLLISPLSQCMLGIKSSNIDRDTVNGNIHLTPAYLLCDKMEHVYLSLSSF